MNELLLGLICGFILGLGLCWRAGRDIQDILNFINEWRAEKKKPQAPQPFITPTHPSFTNENMVGQENSNIVIPKTPQQVQWEEEEELRKLNLKRP